MAGLADCATGAHQSIEPNRGARALSRPMFYDVVAVVVVAVVVVAVVAVHVHKREKYFYLDGSYRPRAQRSIEMSRLLLPFLKILRDARGCSGILRGFLGDS